MIEAEFNIHGLKELEQRLLAISNDDSIAGARVMRSALMSATLPLYRDLQARAPIAKDPRPRKRKTKRGGTVEIRPGFLRVRIRRRSYINKTGHGNRGITEDNGLVKVRLGAYTPYAHHVEFGTEHAPAQPFMRPVIDAGWRGAIQNFRTLLEKRLASYLKRQARKPART